MSSAASRNNPAVEIVEVPFYDDVIEAVRDMRTGIDYVSIRRICENLGIDFGNQLKKLKDYHWATVVNITTVAQDDKQRELALLPMDQVPAWMTHINPEKIGAGPELVEKLKRYQLKTVEVLSSYFLGPQVAQDPIVALAQSVIATRQAQLALEGEVSGLKTGQRALKIRQNSAQLRIAKVEQQVEDLNALRRASIDDLAHVPRADEPADELSVRAMINMLVVDYVNASGMEYSDVWGMLYRHLYRRCGYNAEARCKKSGRRKLAQVEADGYIEKLWRIASELLK
jgi:hypothetical protein